MITLIKYYFLLFLLSFSNAFTIGPLPTRVNQNKLIGVSPGGLSGFYTLGATSYIKENYNLTDYVFLGASAGSWNALLLTGKLSNDHVVNDLLSQSFFYESKKISTLLNDIKNYILTTYHTNDFELNKLYLSVSLFKYFYFKSSVITNFLSLNEAVEGCMSSSYIPFLTGSIRLINLKNIVIDGGWPRFPPNNVKPYFYIRPSMWGRHFSRKDRFRYPSSISFFREMYEIGYNDTRDNKHVLDAYFKLIDTDLNNTNPNNFYSYKPRTSTNPGKRPPPGALF